jgi:hypothetical protein
MPHGSHHYKSHDHYDAVTPEQNPLLDSAEQGPALPGTLFGPTPAQFEAQAAREEAAQRADRAEDARRAAAEERRSDEAAAEREAENNDYLDAYSGLPGQSSGGDPSGEATGDGVQSTVETAAPYLATQELKEEVGGGVSTVNSVLTDVFEVLL